MRFISLALLLATACTSGGKDVIPVDDTDTETDITDTVPTTDSDFDGSPDDRDCEPNNPNIFVGAPEVCDGVDNDCDLQIDDRDDGLDRASATEYFTDADRDGVGYESLGFFCEAPRNAAAVAGDCDDTNGDLFPGNPEICDDVDNDCDLLVDVSDPDLDLSTGETWFADADGDGKGDPATQYRLCAPPLGAANNPDDCDDTDPGQWSGNIEVCDGLDQDCDALIDDQDPDLDPADLSFFYPDVDGDSWGASQPIISACSAPAGYTALVGDCDDAVASINPGGLEVCGGLDEDCDTLIDAGDPSFDATVAPSWYVDLDGDGFGDPASGVNSCTQPPGSVASSNDCDDAQPLAWTGNAESCDSVDNNCDGLLDDADPNIDPTQLVAYALDVDGDGHGDPASQAFACVAPPGAPTLLDDCDDADPLAWTGNPEVCDGSDNDCSGVADDGALNGVTYYVDFDGDGYGDAASAQVGCSPIPGWVTNTGDCNDFEPAAWTGNTETCDGVDNDCDAAVDAADADVLLDPTLYYLDVDGDGFGDPSTGQRYCVLPQGVVADGSDCDDGDGDVRPDAAEVCDGVDNDCDAAVDQDDAGLDPASLSTWYADADGDGFGDDSGPVLACTQPANTQAAGGDCDDAEPLAWSGNTETCDGVDNDCSGAIDDGAVGARDYYADADSDGHGDPASVVSSCSPPAGTVSLPDDCDDAQPRAWTGAAEVCDGVDNDCANGVDDADPAVEDAGRSDFFPDVDRDGFGDPLAAVRACVQPEGLISDASDCDDAEPLAWSGNPEVCDGVDNDCANGVDDADPSLDVSTQQIYFVDGDGDGYGGGAGVLACTPPANSVANDGDCNDAQPLAWTGATEVCDGGIDNDCDALADDRDPSVDRNSGLRLYPDADQDGHGSLYGTFRRCVIYPNTSLVSDDCDDTEPRAWVGAPEVCDGVDNDCTNGADDADPNLDLSSAELFYEDADGDGFGDPLTPAYACLLPPTASGDNTDCDDGSAAAYPGAPEVCDGVDNDCDPLVDEADPDLSYQGVFWYADADGDHYGAGAGVQTCSPAPGAASVAGDCDESTAAVNPGATEACDSLDNDCNGVIDSDTWWDPAWPYRVLVTVDAPAAHDALNPPVSVDVDFAALLADLGDASGFNPDSVRVVHQDCSLGVPEVPSEFMDDISGVFDRVDVVDPVGDASGAVAFLYDEDGDTSTREVFPRGTQATFAVYFGSQTNSAGVPAPAYPSGMATSTDGVTAELSNDWSTGTYLASLGGLLDRFGPSGADGRVGSQSSTLLGNGIYFNATGGGAGGQWISARRDTTGTLSVVHDGPMFGAVRAEGTASGTYGGFAYTYTYLMFDGRPEVYVKTTFVLDRDSHIGPQGTQWTAAVRPVLIDNLALVTAGNGEEGSRDVPGYRWARGGYDLAGAAPLGAAAGYRRDPSHRGSPVYGADGRWIGLAGQDVESAPTAAEISLPAGARVADEQVLLIYPHQGLFSSVSADFYGVLDGTEVSYGVAESR